MLLLFFFFSTTKRAEEIITAVTVYAMYTRFTALIMKYKRNTPQPNAISVITYTCDGQIVIKICS